MNLFRAALRLFAAIIAVTFILVVGLAAVANLFGPVEDQVVEPRCRVIECAGQAVKP